MTLTEMDNDWSRVTALPPPSGLSDPRRPELRVGQIYLEKSKEPPRYVQVVRLRDDGSVVLERVGPASPRSLGRRSVRRDRSFQAAFDFVYEEVVGTCIRCEKRMLPGHGPDYGTTGTCWECFLDTP